MKGYRIETLFGDGITDPAQVAFFEVQNLDNTDIPEYLINHPGNLEEAEISFLKEIINRELDEIDKYYFVEIIEKYCNGRNFCKWLCDSPKDVYDSYIGIMSGNEKISYENAINSGMVSENEFTEYEIPNNAIILSDLGREGKLFCWKEGKK